MVLIEATLWKTSQGLTESNMPTNHWDRHRPYPTPSDSTCVPSAASAKPDRATYEALRRVELDRIRLIDIKRR
jgi:hypothetical protein